MPDLFDTSEVRDDPDHWDALAVRVAAHAAREAEASAFEWLAGSRAGWVAASVLAAAALALIAAPRDKRSVAGSIGAQWAGALAPADDVGRAMVLRDGPPAIAALLVGGPVAGAR